MSRSASPRSARPASPRSTSPPSPPRTPPGSPTSSASASWRARPAARTPPARAAGPAGAGRALPSGGRVQDHLGVPLDPLVELVVGLGCLVEPHVVGHDEARPGPAFDDHVAELAVVD